MEFINGGEPDYLGFPFFTETELLTKIRDVLANNGWDIIDDRIASQSTLIMKAISGVNAHPCWLIFAIDEDPNITNGKRLLLQGDTNGLGLVNDLSPIKAIEFFPGAENRLWAAITESHIAICIGNNNGVSYNGLHGGFCDRVDSVNDSTAWYVGTTSIHPNEHNVAGTYVNNVKWFPIGTDFWRFGEIHPGTMVGSYAGTVDRYTSGFGTSSGTNTELTNSNQNTYYQYQKGCLNRGTSIPVLGDFYLPEGRQNVTGFQMKTGSSLFQFKMIFRGVIPNLVIGMGSLEGGIQITDDSKRYLSTGEVYFCGMRIA